MKVFLDVTCPACEWLDIDVFVERDALPPCGACGTPTVRLWLTGPGITPQGTRPERRVVTPTRGPSAKARATAIAAETTREIEQKWARYSDPRVAEQMVSREINHAAGLADERGNVLPQAKPAPLTLAREA